jgi:hypothetical protein
MKTYVVTWVSQNGCKYVWECRAEDVRHALVEWVANWPHDRPIMLSVA